MNARNRRDAGCITPARWARRTLAALTVLAGLAGTSTALLGFTATPAAAQTQPGAVGAAAGDYSVTSLPDGQPFDYAFFQSLQSMLLAMTPGTCYQRARSGPTPIAFVGIPETNAYFNDALKSQINEFAKASIRKNLPLFLRINDGATLRTIAALSQVNASDQIQLRRAIAEVRGAPLTLVIRAERPARDIARLRIELFSRGISGYQDCPTSEEFFVRLDTFNVIPRTAIDARFLAGEYVDGRHAFRHGLRKSAARIRRFEELGVTLDLQMTGACRFAQTALDAFRSDFFAVEGEIRNPFGDDSRWPSLMLSEDDDLAAASASAEGPTAGGTADQAVRPQTGGMRVRLALFPAFNDVVDVTIDVTRGRVQTYSTFYRMIASPADLAGCRPLSTDPLVRLVEDRVPGDALRMNPVKRPFRANRDPIEVSLGVASDSYLYCWILDDKLEAFVVYPWRAEQLATPWARDTAGTYPNDFTYTSPDGSERQGLGTPMLYPSAARDVFGCFASATRLPEALEKRWIDAHPWNTGGSGIEKSLTAREVKAFLRDMRRQKGITEAYAFIEVAE